MVARTELQRLSNFQRFLNNKLKLRDAGREKLNPGKKFLDLTRKVQESYWRLQSNFLHHRFEGDRIFHRLDIFA